MSGPSGTDSSAEILEGILDRIVYQNAENGYTVARMLRSGLERVTVVGNLAGVQPGESLRVTGKWIHNERFGDQFEVERFESVLPGTEEGIEKYLSSGLIRGIGPVYAKRIVAKFGKETLDVIEESLERLGEVEGIGRKRLKIIRDAWEEHRAIHQIMVFLQSHGISSTLATRIFRAYGEKSISAVTENPYRLASDIRGIGFHTADRIAQSLGISKESEVRIDAAALYVLGEMASDGHTCYPVNRLVEEMSRRLELSEGLSTGACSRLAQSGAVVLETGGEGEEYCYLRDLHTAEDGVRGLLAELLRCPRGLVAVHPENAVKWYEDKEKIQLSEEQAAVVRAAAESKVAVVTGGPGTGKTTVIRALTRIFRAKKAALLLAAPTGRAAKRMEEATGHSAQTVHKLLEFSPREGRFMRNSRRPLEGDLIVVDEASMMDIGLMYHLLEAVPRTSTLLLVGDADQLPSVGPGDVLRDLIRSGVVPVVRLAHIFRQAEQSRIVTNAHRINHGEMPDFGEETESDEELSDFYWIERTDPEKALETVLDLVCGRIPDRFGMDPIMEIQVLTPMHKGNLGVGNLNRELQSRLQERSGRDSQGPQVELGRFRLAAGDKVIQLVNNYDKEVYNGEMGCVAQIDPVDQMVTVDFEGRKVPYLFRELDEISLAYAISVHKSQGSEYPAVVMPLVTQHYIMLHRNLLYTAITRAKRLVVLVGTTKALRTAVRRGEAAQRCSLLERRLAGMK